MTYRTKRAVSESLTLAAASLAFLAVPFVAAEGLSFAAAWATGSAAFLALFLLQRAAAAWLDARSRRACFRSRETRIVADFSERLSRCFTLPELIDAIRDELESAADMGVLLARASPWEIVYKSASKAANARYIEAAFEERFKDSGGGLLFFDEDLVPTPGSSGSRGFVVSAGGYRLLVLTLLCPRIESEAFRVLCSEAEAFGERLSSMARLYEVASLSREWDLVAQTQRSFLPRELPRLAGLELAAVYQPLVDVSGDYYDAIAIDENRSLLVIGDVSGKGLAAALVMGIIVSTIRVAPEASDLGALVRSVDAAIKGMGFDDKFTVLFLGLADRARGSLRYVNAAMPDPIILRGGRGGDGLRSLERLEPTMGLVGILPLASIHVEEVPFRSGDLLLLATDGVTEAADPSGSRFGETELFEHNLLETPASSARAFASSLAARAVAHAGSSRLKDDLTILAAKAVEPWA
jgi:Serine phosphatase RsbU, regulator of sigma subunit